MDVLRLPGGEAADAEIAVDALHHPLEEFLVGLPRAVASSIEPSPLTQPINPLLAAR